MSTVNNKSAEILLHREQAGEFIKQRTPEWYKTRNNMLTASEISSIVGCNTYQSNYDLMIKKLSVIETPLNNIQPINTSRPATEWGNLFEPIALKFYEFLKGETVYSIGLVTHHKYEWLGASPDGLLLSGKLLEIKCLYTRNISDTPPEYYWVQMQIQMEVCNIDECDYLECKFYNYKNAEEYTSDIAKTKGISDDGKIYWRLDNCSLKTVKRDTQWFAEHISQIECFYDKLTLYKNMGSTGFELIYNEARNKKRPRLDNISVSEYNTFVDWRQWVSPSNIRNYMTDDPIVDWLEYYGADLLNGCGVTRNQNRSREICYVDGEYKLIDPPECSSLIELMFAKTSYETTHITPNKPTNNAHIKSHNNTFQSFIMEQGRTFEGLIANKIRERFPADFIEIGGHNYAKSSHKYLETIYHIKNGTPIIYQGILHDYDTKLYGIPDLIIRSDYLNKLFNNVISAESIPNNTTGGPWHYRIVEIKYSILRLSTDGRHLLNGDKNMVSNKGQIYIYNNILGKIQNYTAPKAYIIGKKTIYTKEKTTVIRGSFDSLAHINFNTNDTEIRTKVSRAIKWVRNMRDNGHKWKLFPPDVQELRPNMCATTGGCQSIKGYIAEKQHDVTELWMCGINNRECADRNKVINWRITPNLTPKMLGITGEKTGKILQLIINYNQDINPIHMLISPPIINSKLFDWRANHDVEMFIDFETINDLISGGNGSMIFNIGVGYTISGKYNFAGFIANGLTIEDESVLMVNFHNFVYDISQKYNGGRHPKLWHWSHAERTFYAASMVRYLDIIPNNMRLTNFCDMLKIFKTEPIVVRGALNFSLKSIVKAFSAHKFIKTDYKDSQIIDGLDAMVMAHQEYIKCKSNNSQFRDSKIIKDIEYYNQIDCRVLHEILEYLREAH